MSDQQRRFGSRRVSAAAQIRPQRSSWPAVGEFLRVHTGNDFPVFQHHTHARAIRALATMVRDNCTPSESRLGLDVKHSTGLVYATVVQDDALAEQARLLASSAGARDLDVVALFAADAIDFDNDAAVERAARQHGGALVLAKAASYSPARITPPVVEVARALPCDGVVELVTWLNLVERWFAELTNKKLRRGAHRSVGQLNADIRAWIGTWNQNPNPFVWTKTADQILESIARYCTRINESRH